LHYLDDSDGGGLPSELLNAITGSEPGWSWTASVLRCRDALNAGVLCGWPFPDLKQHKNHWRVGNHLRRLLRLSDPAFRDGDSLPIEQSLPVVVVR